jgi:hypothetical protein
MTDTATTTTGIERDLPITARDRFRLYLYLESVHDWMPRISRRAWRPLRRELMADTIEAARRVGIRQAIADLGPARSLANHYYDALGLSRGPLWLPATYAMCGVWVVLTALAMAFDAGLVAAASRLDAAQQIGARFLGVRFWAGPGGSAGAEMDWHGLLVPAILVVVFLVVGRFWRLIPACRPSEPGDR